MRDEHLFASLDDARRRVLDNVRIVGTEKVGLADALGRVLRQRVVSDIDYPRADLSSMDGYCLDSRDASGASTSKPLTLPVRGVSTPGAEPPRLEPETCVLITTGAPLAAGADTVIKYEDVMENREGAEVASITLSRPVPPGECVRKRGEVTRKGSTVLEPGKLINPQVLGILASFAGEPYEVSRRPLAGVLATGDELMPPGRDPAPLAIRDSNSPTLAGMLEDAGCRVLRAGRTEDTETRIVRELEACADCDIVMISGGVSGGRFDFVPAALERLGARIVFRGVRMRPGKPVLFAIGGDTFYFGLPGNPVSVVVSFHMLFRPAILAMLGRPDCMPVSVRATAAGVFVRKPPYMSFAPAVLASDLTVRPVRYLGSGDIVSLAEANALVCVPEDVDEIGAGGAAEAYPLGWFKGGGDE